MAYEQKNMTGSLWTAKDEMGEKKKTKKGDTYYSGHCTIGGKKYFVNLFKVHERNSDKSPELNLLFSEPKWQQQGTNPVADIRNAKQNEVPF